MSIVSVNAQENPPIKPPVGEDRIERPPGPIECFEELKYCTYVIQNIEKASSLINKILPILFPNGIIDFEKGHMKQLGNNTNKISFWYEHDKTGSDEGSLIFERMKALLMKEDSLEEFSPSALIEVNTEIYAVTEEALTSMRAEISGINFGNNIETPNVSAGDAGLSFSMNVGTANLSAIIGAQRATRNATKISSITQIVNNLDSLNYSQVTPISIPLGNSGKVQELEAGIKLNGTVTVNRDNKELVGIKDFGFSYGVMDPKNPNLVNTLKVNKANMYLEEGVSFGIVSSNTEENINATNIRLLGLSRERQKINTKIVIYNTVKVYSFAEFSRMNHELVRKKKTVYFTPDEVTRLEEKNKLTMNEVFGNIQLSATNTLSGDPELRFILDKKLATKENYNKLIKIKIRGKGINEKRYMNLENLMLRPFVLKRMPIDNLNKSLVRVRIKLQVKGERGDEFKRTIKAYYNPAVSDSSTSFFIRPEN